MTLDEVLERLLSAAAPHRIPDTETLPTTAALGRVLGEDIVSPLDVPPADNSSMDGYALRVADLVAPGTVLPVSQRIPAGVVGAPLQAGTAARIFTGAQVPPPDSPSSTITTTTHPFIHCDLLECRNTLYYTVV